MEIWQMRYFIQVYNDKSFSKASKNLYISQQGLSKTIRNMEDELQISLFERSSKGVNPTEYGDILLEKTQEIVNIYDQMIEFLHSKTKSKDETISIGVSNILYNDFFATIICNFQEEYPGLKLELIELGSYACEKYLEDNIIDICFAVKPDNNIAFEFIKVSVYDMILLVDRENDLNYKTSVKLKDLENEKFIMLSADYKISKLTMDCCLQSGFRPNIIFTTSQLDLIIELVTLNKGVAILPEINAMKISKTSDNAAVILFEETPFKIEIGFIINKHQRLNYVTNNLVNYTLKFIKSIEV